MKRLLVGFALLCATPFILENALSAQNYRLSRVRPSRYEVTSALDLIPDQAAMDFVKPYTAAVDSLRMPFVGRSAVQMDANRPESRLTNWVADVMKWAGERLTEHVDMGLCNKGGLRASMPKGIVRKGDILAIAPFENNLSVLKLKGSDLTHLFENIAYTGGEGVSRGVQLVIDKSKRALVSATLNEPIDPERIYTIATLDYLADGNDKLTALKNAVDRHDTTIPVRDLLADYFAWLNEQSKEAEAEVEGRIKVRGADSPPALPGTPLPVKEGEVTNENREPVGTPPLYKRGGRGVSPDKSLLILHTNDTHSCIEPLNPNLSDKTQADKGGYLRRASFVREMRKREPDLLLLDCGDFSQGSTYYSLYHGDVEVGLMNLMGYDAATIGNHEFDFGVENMARIFRMAKFPIVCCNYDFTGTACEGLVKPYTIIERSGLKIGILGVSPKLEGLVAAATCQGVTFTDPIKAAQPVADYLRKEEHCDLVICLSHLGWKVDGVSDDEFIEGTRNIDVVLGGHSHTYFTRPEVLQNLDGQNVPNHQMGKNGQFIGLLELGLEMKDKR